MNVEVLLAEGGWVGFVVDPGPISLPARGTNDHDDNGTNGLNDVGPGSHEFNTVCCQSH